MRANDLPSVPVPCRRPRNRGDPDQIVVRVRGEHDIATRNRLSVRLAKAAGRDDADIVVDLSGVTFMDASTIGALVVARNNLRVLSRSLSLRHPSAPAQWLLDLCGLAQLIDEEPVQPPRAVKPAKSIRSVERCHEWPGASAGDPRTPARPG